MQKMRNVRFRSFGLLIMLGAAWQGVAKDSKTPYPKMAPLDQYLMERSAEIALARSAGPPAIAQDADVLVFGKHGYETAVHGKNGFVCMVERSWSAPLNDPNFWNPKLRGPICLNPAAARSYLPLVMKKTQLVLAGRSEAEMAKEVSAAIDSGKLPKMEPGAMSYMLSKEGDLGNGGPWHPHIMFFTTLCEPGAWGADLPGSPVLSSKDDSDRLTIFMIPVKKWSDGTADVAPRMGGN